ncbi:hypothetical protein D3C80_1604010 [compost metagenome]
MAPALMSSAIRLAAGATYSPIRPTSSIRGIAVLSAAMTMLILERPDACITTSSELVASWPRPMRPPSKAASGKKSTASLGMESSTK